MPFKVNHFQLELLPGPHCAENPGDRAFEGTAKRSLAEENHQAEKWAHLGSNQGPTGYEPVALPTELWAL
jgi:hypothetical protein